MITVILPWPAHGLSPNAREHYRAKAALVKQARLEAMLSTLDQEPRAKLPAGKPLSMTMVFCRPTARKQDLDNLIAACKSYQDGVADALGFNDEQIKSVTGTWGEPYAGGRVELRLEVLSHD